MAKRRSKMAKLRAARRLNRGTAQLRPSGNSSYGLKHAGQKRGVFLATSPFIAMRDQPIATAI